jgi:hypothetical protein
VCSTSSQSRVDCSTLRHDGYSHFRHLFYGGRASYKEPDMAPLGFIKLEIPTPMPQPPTGEGWIHEINYDGYRTLIVIDQGRVRAYSRPGRDWTDYIAGWSLPCAISS